MKHSNTEQWVTRRRFITGSAGLAAIGLASPLWSASFCGVGQMPAPRTWLGRIDDDLESGVRIKPAGALVSSLRTDHPLRLRVRGPWLLSADAALPDMALSMIYRQRPQHPFLLWKNTVSAGPISLQLHAHAAALAAIEVRCKNRVVQCSLTGLFNSSLSAGRYVLMIDPEGRHPGPAWTNLDLDAESGKVISSVADPDLAALLLDVSAA